MRRRRRESDDHPAMFWSRGKDGRMFNTEWLVFLCHFISSLITTPNNLTSFIISNEEEEEGN